MMKEQLIEVIEREKLIVIVRGVKTEKLIELGEALYDGGVRLMEITFDATGAVSDEMTAEGISLLAKYFAGRMHIGAGTVITEKQVELTWRAGGTFIISPDTNEAVIAKTKELGMISIPGALTPTEAQKAHRAGADFVKLFPAGSLGASYLKAICAPLSHIRFLVVGGIDEKNIPEYRKAGARGFGIGSAIVNAKALEQCDAAQLTALAKKYVDTIEKLD